MERCALTQVPCREAIAEIERRIKTDISCKELMKLQKFFWTEAKKKSL